MPLGSSTPQSSTAVLFVFLFTWHALGTVFLFIDQIHGMTIFLLSSHHFRIWVDLVSQSQWMTDDQKFYSVA